MSQKKNTPTSANSLFSMPLDKSLQFFKWIIGTFLPKVAKFTWAKSFSASGFVIEVIEDQRGTPIHHLWRRFWKNLFSTIIFIIVLILLAILINIFL